MRWIVCVVIAGTVLWLGYAASPFLAVYDLAHALERRDGAAVARRVNFPAVRQSLTEQVASTYLQLTGKDQRLGQVGRSMAIAVASSIAEPIVAKLISAEAVTELLHDGWPSSALPEKMAGTLPALTSGSLGGVWQVFLHSRQGVRTFVVSVPVAEPQPRRFKLQFRLTAWTWKLSAVELPEHLRARLVQELTRQGR